MSRVRRIWLTHFWFQFLVYPRRDVPLTEIGQTQEAGYPWRIGRCRVFRAPFTRRAVAVGQWTGYQEREIVDGSDTFRLRELPRWEDVVHVRDEDRLAG